MLRADTVLAAGHWEGETADSVVLDFDERHRRRVTLTGVQGLTCLLDLKEAVVLRGGDALKLEDGRLVEVVAAPEPLVEVRGRTPADLVRLAWHVGNRHLPAQITGKAIRLRRDHVIEDMLRGLNATLVDIEAPFDPEGGAYVQAPEPAHEHGGHHHHEHGHHDAHDHGHDHHDHHAHDHDHGHRHG